MLAVIMTISTAALIVGCDEKTGTADNSSVTGETTSSDDSVAEASSIKTEESSVSGEPVSFKSESFIDEAEKVNLNREEIQYNEAGDFYETVKNDVIRVELMLEVSSLFRNQMFIEYEDTSLVYVFSSERVTLIVGESSGKTMQIVYGDRCVFGFDSILTDLSIPEYISVIAKDGDEIVGYGLLKWFPDKPVDQAWKVLKFAFICREKEQNRTVTEQMIDSAIEAIKNN